MIHIANDIYLDADRYQFILIKKGTVKDENSANFGMETFTDIGYYADVQQVNRKIQSLCAQEYINGDWNRMMELFKKANENLTSKLNDIRTLRKVGC